jgi:hypothetical protein
MANFTELTSAPSNHPVPFTDQPRLAVAAYLARFKGSSREHTQSDLRSFLTWCAERSLDPLVARRPHLELYIRWMQEIRADIADLGEEHGHPVLRACGKGHQCAGGRRAGARRAHGDRLRQTAVIRMRR